MIQLGRWEAGSGERGAGRFTLLSLFLLTALGSRSLYSQQTPVDSGPLPPPTTWLTSYLPFIGAAPNDIPAIQFRWRRWLMADYDDRVTARQTFNAMASYTFKGGWLVGVRYDGPGLSDGWRLRASIAAARDVRYGYFGLGNNTEIDKDLADDTQPYLYRMRRRRIFGTGELSRRITGPLWAAALINVTDAQYTALPGPSVFRTDFGSQLDEDEISGRLALIYDTRDTEYDTRRGLLAEAGIQYADHANNNYTRWYGIVRGWVPVKNGIVLAGRVLASDIRGSATLDSRYELPAWDRTVALLGGEDSHRSLDNGRFAGTGALVANVEARIPLKSFGDYGAINLLLFADAGRVYEGERLRLVTDDFTTGGGFGLGIRVLRGNIFTLNMGFGPDGPNFSARTGWMF